MASESPCERLRHEVTCPICLEYFVKPVSLPCEHNFCYSCIMQSWAMSPTSTLCPLCKRTFHQEDLKPNDEVVHFALLIRRLNEKEEDRKAICERHQEPLKLFCKADRDRICTLCEKDHQNHSIVPVEEATKECKDRISKSLAALHRRKDKMMKTLSISLSLTDNLLKQMTTEREKVAARFKDLWPFLKKQECLALARMKQIKKQMERKRDQQMDRLSRQLSTVEVLIQEMEKKRRLPATQLLKDVGSILQRSEQKMKLKNALFFKNQCFHPVLNGKVLAFSARNVTLKSAMKEFEAEITLAVLILNSYFERTIEVRN